MFATFAMLMQNRSDDGLTLMELIRDLPHDGPAVVAYLMIAAMIAFIWIGSTQSVIARGAKRDGEAGRPGPAEATAAGAGRREAEADAAVGAAADVEAEARR